MDPRLQAGLELQLEKRAQQEYESSLSGVLGQYFKQAALPPDAFAPEPAASRSQAARSDERDNFIRAYGARDIPPRKGPQGRFPDTEINPEPQQARGFAQAAPGLAAETGPSPLRRAWDWTSARHPGYQAGKGAIEGVGQAKDLLRKDIDQLTGRVRGGVNRAVAKTQSAVGGTLSDTLSKYIGVSKPLNQATKAVQGLGVQGMQVPVAAAGVVRDTASAAGSNLKYLLNRRQQESDARSQAKTQAGFDAGAQQRGYSDRISPEDAERGYLPSQAGTIPQRSRDALSDIRAENRRRQARENAK
jgi:hypothetical protein